MFTNYLYLKKWIKKIFNVEKIKTLTFYILLFLIPFKTSKHFFISESILNGKIIDYFLPTIYIQDFLIIIFILFSLISFLKKRNSKVISKYQKIISLMFLLFIPLLLFFNHQYLKDKIFIIKYLRVIEYIFLIVSILIQKKNFLDVKKITIIFSLSSLLISLIVIGEFILQQSLGFKFLGEWDFNSNTSGLATFYLNGFNIIRPGATFPHPNIIAFYVSLISSLNIYLLFIKRQKRYLFIFLINTLAIALLFSKIGYLLFFINIIISSIYLSFIHRDKLETRLKSKNKLFAVFIIIIILMISPLFIIRTNSLLLSDYSSLERRYFLNEIAIRSIEKNIIKGVGLNRFLFQFNSDDFSNLYSFVQPVHNFYLLFLSENGIIVFILFLFILLFGLFLQIDLFIDKEKNFFRLFLIIFCILFIIASFWDHYFYSLFQGNLIFSVFISLSLLYRE